jgi:uncharacterized membrane protein YgaE (UPF0421/DUF939 family)
MTKQDDDLIEQVDEFIEESIVMNEVLDKSLRQCNPKHIPLNTLDDIRKEQARIYRQTVAKSLDPNVATKQSYMLQGLTKTIETIDYKNKLVILEHELNKILKNQPKKIGR